MAQVHTVKDANGKADLAMGQLAGLMDKHH